MNALKNLKLRLRLSLGFGLVVLLLVGVSILGMASMAQIQNRLNEISLVNNKQASLAVGLRHTVSEMALRSRDIVLYDGTRKRAAIQNIQRARDDYEAKEKALEEMFNAHPATSVQEKELLAKIKALRATAAPLLGKVVALGRSDMTEDAARVLADEVDRPM